MLFPIGKERGSLKGQLDASYIILYVFQPVHCQSQEDFQVRFEKCVKDQKMEICEKESKNHSSQILQICLSFALKVEEFGHTPIILNKTL